MGMTDAQRAQRDADVAALVAAAVPEPKKEPGHGRRSQREVLHNPGGSPELRGVPLVGAGPGAIDGTAPGPGASGAALEQEARDLNEHARLILRDRLRYRT